jgi:hypothetical protein
MPAPGDEVSSSLAKEARLGEPIESHCKIVPVSAAFAVLAR